MPTGSRRLRDPCATKNGRDLPSGYFRFGGPRIFREMLVMEAIGNEWQHRKPEIFSSRGKCSRIADKGRARGHALRAAHTPVQFTELPQFDRRLGQEAGRGFLRGEDGAM